MYSFIKLINNRFILDGSTGKAFYAEAPLIEAFRQLFDLPWKAVGNIDSEALKAAKQLVLKKIGEGDFKESPFKGVEKYAEATHATELAQMSLVVTEECNLRCRYCQYSCSYKSSTHRSHSSTRMDRRTADRAIDLFKRLSVCETALGFYGGEPLLNFDLIMYVVNRINNEIPDRRIIFTITSNLNYLNDEIAHFLAKNNFLLNVSLDGPEEIHNRHRKRADGTGSYEKVIENINYIKSRYPHYFSEHITSNTVLSSHYDLDSIDCFFSNIPYDFRSCGFNPANDSNEDFYPSINSDLYSECQLIDNWVYDKLKSNITPEQMSKSILLKALLGRMVNIAESSWNIRNALIPFKGCFPGHKIFVKADGVLSVCEKCESIIIGHVDTGVDHKKVKHIVDVWTSIIEKECLGCWAVSFCNTCLKAAWDKNGFDLDFFKRHCDSFRSRLLNILAVYLDKKTDDSGYFSFQGLKL